MNSAQLFGRSISFPPRIGTDGRMAWSQGEDNIRESIRIILLTEQTERIMHPNFGGGLSRYLFEPNTISTYQVMSEQIQKALADWEPRIALESVEIVPDPEDPQAAIVNLLYRLVATHAHERLSLNIRLA